MKILDSRQAVIALDSWSPRKFGTEMDTHQKLGSVSVGNWLTN